MNRSRRLQLATFITVTLALGAPAARADLIDLYVQGQGGYGGSSNDELMPGGAEPSIGAGLGLRAGAKVMFFEGYVDRTHFFKNDASATRAILGLTGGLSLGPIRVIGRAGAGLVGESNGGIDGNFAVSSRSGLAARIGGAIEAGVASHVSVGFMLEDEWYRLSDDDSHTGSDALGALYLKLDFGI